VRLEKIARHTYAEVPAHHGSLEVARCGTVSGPFHGLRPQVSPYPAAGGVVRRPRPNRGAFSACLFGRLYYMAWIPSDLAIWRLPCANACSTIRLLNVLSAPAKRDCRYDERKEHDPIALLRPGPSDHRLPGAQADGDDPGSEHPAANRRAR